MKPKERLENLLAGRPVDRPPFYPALYDFKAGLMGVAPHRFALSSDEVTSALRREAKELHAEILTSAYDIYNIEAEAAGAHVIRREGLPMPEIECPMLSRLGDVEKLPRLQGPAGRMPLFINAAKAAHAEFGAAVPVRLGLSGPFSLASKIFPREELLMECVMNPEGVKDLLVYCSDLIETYLRAFAGPEIGAVIFDSFIAPPMLSPSVYAEVVLPFHQRLFSFLKVKGVGLRALIAGGNTLPLLPHLVESGANQLLLDYTIPLDKVGETLARYPATLFRVNIPSASVADKGIEKAVAETEKTAAAVRGFPNVIIGTGILPPHTPMENIRAVREAVIKSYE